MHHVGTLYIYYISFSSTLLAHRDVFCQVICYGISVYGISPPQKLPFWTFCYKDTVSLVSHLSNTPLTNRVTQKVTPKRPVSLYVTFTYRMSYLNCRPLRFFLNSHNPHILLSAYNKYCFLIEPSLTLSVFLKFRCSQPLSFCYIFVNSKLLITEDNFPQSKVCTSSLGEYPI